MLKKALELIKIDTGEEKYLKDISAEQFCGFPLLPIIEAEENLLAKEIASVAYFSMEYGLAPSIYHTFKSVNPIKPENLFSEHEVFSNMKDMDYYHLLPLKKILDLPIYSGGLGVLAGDLLKSAADIKKSLCGIGILWNKGYFKQKFWFKTGGQSPEELSWDPHSYPGLVPLKNKISMTLSGAKLHLKLWKYYVFAYDLKSAVPLILLDSNLPENPDYLRSLTAQLYRSDNGWIKLAQRMILGIGGVLALEAMGYAINKYHLNEGHAAFAFIEKALKNDPENLKAHFAYTCHTPVEAGHDRFNLQEVEAALGPAGTELIKKYGRDPKDYSTANLTMLAMNTSQQINGVAEKHGEITRLQFPMHKDRIISITNGVHTHTWISNPIRNLLKKYKDQIGDWENDPTLLANLIQLRENPEFRRELWHAHHENKKHLAEFLKFWFFDEHTFTLSWARRLAPYKRPGLLLQNPDRLLRLAKKYGGIQIIIAGKAHPADLPASLHMEEILGKISALDGERKHLRICFLENYDTYIAKILVSSVDVWLNNPLPPFEASGTSGMKAILNGVVQCSTLDGWVVEAADKNIGKIFGYAPPAGEIGHETNLHLKEDAEALYQALEELMPQYYDLATGRTKPEESKWVDMMINCIAAAGFFNTQRMVNQYNQLIWEK
ncbi:MAG: alpha-glucan family phosphorylase [Candidatus Margulisiibacteriota bacterium]